jgi:hypothetical protein
VLITGVSVGHHSARLSINVTGLRRILELGDGPGLEPPPDATIEAPLLFRRRGVQLKLAVEGRHSPVTAEFDTTLVTAIARGFDWFERLSTGQAKSIDELAKVDGFDPAYISHVLPLAFLSPAAVEKMLAGQQPAGLTADRLIWHEEVPPRWANFADCNSQNRNVAMK